VTKRDRRGNGNSGEFHMKLERNDVCRITASFVKSLARCQSQSRVHLTRWSATSTIRESRTYGNWPAHGRTRTINIRQIYQNSANQNQRNRLFPFYRCRGN